MQLTITNKDVHINPDDDSTTIIKRATACCGGYHQTIAGALLKSKEWKAWYKLASKYQSFDVDEAMILDCMSDRHFRDFIKFIKKQK